MLILNAMNYLTKSLSNISCTSSSTSVNATCFRNGCSNISPSIAFQHFLLRYLNDSKGWHCSDPPFKDISPALETSYFKQMVCLPQIPIEPVFTIHILYLWNTNNIWSCLVGLGYSHLRYQYKYCPDQILRNTNIDLVKLNRVHLAQEEPSKAEQLSEFHQSQPKPAKARIGFQSW